MFCLTCSPKLYCAPYIFHFHSVSADCGMSCKYPIAMHSNSHLTPPCVMSLKRKKNLVTVTSQLSSHMELITTNPIDNFLLQIRFLKHNLWNGWCMFVKNGWKTKLALAYIICYKCPIWDNKFPQIWLYCAFADLLLYIFFLYPSFSSTSFFYELCICIKLDLLSPDTNLHKVQAIIEWMEANYFFCNITRFFFFFIIFLSQTNCRHRMLTALFKICKVSLFLKRLDQCEKKIYIYYWIKYWANHLTIPRAAFVRRLVLKPLV